MKTVLLAQLNECSSLDSERIEWAINQEGAGLQENQQISLNYGEDEKGTFISTVPRKEGPWTIGGGPSFL